MSLTAPISPSKLSISSNEFVMIVSVSINRKSPSIRFLKFVLIHLDLYFIGAEKSQIPEAAVIGAEKGCDWIGKCLEYYNNRPFIKEDGSLDILVVPHIILKQASLIKPVRVLSIDDSIKIKGLDLRKEMLVLNDAFFSPKIFDSRKVQLTPYTYAIHHFNNTWFSPKAKIYYRCRSVVVNMIGLKAVRKTESIVMPRKFKRHK